MKKAKARKPSATYRSKLEEDYARRLEILLKAGQLVEWHYEPMRFRLGKGAWYTPDFVIVQAKSMHIECHEVKGFWREAARVRIKVAASKYTMYEFKAVTRDKKGAWEFEEL